MGVALSSTVTLLPVGNADHDLLRPHRLGSDCSSLGQGELAIREISRPPARRNDTTPSRSSGDWSGLRRLSTIRRASRLKDLGTPSGGVKDHHAHRRDVLISVSRSFPGLLLLPVTAGRWR